MATRVLATETTEARHAESFGVFRCTPKYTIVLRTWFIHLPKWEGVFI